MFSLSNYFIWAGFDNKGIFFITYYRFMKKPNLKLQLIVLLILKYDSSIISHCFIYDYFKHFHICIKIKQHLRGFYTRYLDMIKKLYFMYNILLIYNELSTKTFWLKYFIRARANQNLFFFIRLNYNIHLLFTFVTALFNKKKSICNCFRI